MDLEEPGFDEPFNLDERVDFISSRLKNSYTYWAMKRLAKEEIIKPKYKQQDLEENFPKILKDLEVDIKFKNKINELYTSMFSLDSNNNFAISLMHGLDASKPIPPLPPYFTHVHVEPLESVTAARQQWTQFVRTRYLSLSYELDKPLVSVRKTPWQFAIPEERKDEGDEEMERKNEKIEEIPFVYDDENMLNTILSINNGNFRKDSIEWGSIKLHIRTPPIDMLRSQYEELDVCYKHLGVDDDRAFMDERTAIGEKLLNKDYVPYMVQYAKRGIPNSLRCRFYMKILEVNISSKDQSYFDYLIEQTQKWELSLDKVILYDARDVCNDDRFFIFHEVLEKIFMAFVRDPWVGENLRALPNLPLTGISNDGRSIGNVPPCSVIPFKRFSRYIAPFTFVSDKPEECYFVFRNFYCKYLCYLHSLTSDERGIISLCRLFEDVLQAYDPDMVYKLYQLGVSPLKIAFPWIFYCFIGFIEVEQTFMLWDRIIGYDSPEIVALLAASLFIYRTDLIMQCSSQEEIEDLFYDLQHVKVMPLLQNFLFIEKYVV
ncbi:unnamed protein product [Blepharisma stoltei]|uniref:Rab-GAP TBC domain-containing protein n=1 Tax=Blepharisma stoltei TaxID=1481888 RepID=A0AAU9IMZ5_9CILI|nr:unnamed protein product [Blepharisma stoltei]